MKRFVLGFLLLLGCGSDPSTGSGGSGGGAGGSGGGTGGSGGSPPACNVGTPSDPMTVATTRGLVSGQTSGATVSFLGIPYAEPPIGARRWQAPAEHACWEGVRPGNQYGNECPQKNAVTSAIEGNEDCLFANVWTPALPRPGAAGRPVLFFIHGGANVVGSSNQNTGLGNLYDGAGLATREDAVVVTINYRLGELGFLAHPALDAENSQGISGNYAILDIVQALHWVQDNIAAFGGDPARVLVFGESAGAINTCMMMTTPLAAGLFSSALMESGWCPAVPKANAEQSGQTFVQQLGCATGDVAGCLRTKSTTDVMNASPGFADITHSSAMPVAVIDGVVFPDAPERLLAMGQHAKVPFAIGSNRDEEAIFISSPVATCTDYENDVRTGFGTVANQVLAHYPCTSYATPKAAEVAVLTDAVFTCAARRVARAIAATQSQPVYRYYYTHVSGGLQASYGAYHSAELAYVFGTFGSQGYLASPADQALSGHIEDYWGRLARAGDPNAGSSTLAWPTQSASDTVVVLDEPLATTTNPEGAQCDFWDSLSP